MSPVRPSDQVQGCSGTAALQSHAESPQKFTSAARDGTEMSPTSGRQTLVGLEMAPPPLRFKQHLKKCLPMNELKIKSIESYAVLGILFLS